MSRTIATVAILTGLAGFAAGWLAFGSRSVPEPSATDPAPPPAVARPHDPVAVRYEFALRPEDMQADRETPTVAADSKGRVLLAWASQTGPAERTLFLARSNDGGRSFESPEPWRKVPIYRFASRSKGKAMTFSTHVLPRLVATHDALDLGWVEAVQGGPEVAFYVSSSRDGGRTVSEPQRVHGAEAVKPGFTTLAAGPNGSLLAAWLDGRAQGQRPYSSRKPADADRFAPEQLVYEGPEGRGVCPCCDLAVAEAPDGTRFVAFRNSADGNRDIWLARQGPQSKTFEPPVPVARDHWKLEACPHDGPTALVSGGRLHLLWMDAHTGKNRVYTADASLSTLQFQPREINPASPRAQGHPKLAADASGRLLAVWDEALDASSQPAPAHGEHGQGHGAALTGSGRAIMFAASDGRGFGPPTSLAPRPGAFQLQPAIATGPGGSVYVAWNELDTQGKRVVFARLFPDAGTMAVSDKAPSPSVQPPRPQDPAARPPR